MELMDQEIVRSLTKNVELLKIFCREMFDVICNDHLCMTWHSVRGWDMVKL